MRVAAWLAENTFDLGFFHREIVAEGRSQNVMPLRKIS